MNVLDQVSLHVARLPNILYRAVKEGSEQEFDRRPISCGFSKHDEFGFGDRHSLSLEEQVAQVLIAATAP